MKRELITRPEFEQSLDQFEKEIRAELNPVETESVGQEIYFLPVEENAPNGGRYIDKIGVLMHTMTYSPENFAGVMAAIDKVKNFLDCYEFTEDGIFKLDK